MVSEQPVRPPNRVASEQPEVSPAIAAAGSMSVMSGSWAGTESASFVAVCEAAADVYHLQRDEAWQRDVDNFMRSMEVMANAFIDASRVVTEALDALGRSFAEFAEAMTAPTPVDRARSAKERAAQARERGLPHRQRAPCSIGGRHGR